MAYAYETGIITDADLRRPWATPTEGVIESVQRRVEETDGRGTFLDQWQRHDEELERGPELETVDLRALLRGIETVLEFHLDGEGRE